MKHGEFPRETASVGLRLSAYKRKPNESKRYKLEGTEWEFFTGVSDVTYESEDNISQFQYLKKTA